MTLRVISVVLPNLPMQPSRFLTPPPSLTPFLRSRPHHHISKSQLTHPSFHSPNLQFPHKILPIPYHLPSPISSHISKRCHTPPTPNPTPSSSSSSGNTCTANPPFPPPRRRASWREPSSCTITRLTWRWTCAGARRRPRRSGPRCSSASTRRLPGRRMNSTRRTKTRRR